MPPSGLALRPMGLAVAGATSGRGKNGGSWREGGVSSGSVGRLTGKEVSQGKDKWAEAGEEQGGGRLLWSGQQKKKFSSEQTPGPIGGWPSPAGLYSLSTLSSNLPTCLINV